MIHEEHEETRSFNLFFVSFVPPSKINCVMREIYTFGNEDGEHTSQWHDDTFYYSSIGINANLEQMVEGGLKVAHLELDQYPQKHVYVVGVKELESKPL